MMEWSIEGDHGLTPLWSELGCTLYMPVGCWETESSRSLSDQNREEVLVTHSRVVQFHHDTESIAILLRFILYNQACRDAAV